MHVNQRAYSFQKWYTWSASKIGIFIYNSGVRTNSRHGFKCKTRVKTPWRVLLMWWRSAHVVITATEIIASEVMMSDSLIFNSELLHNPTHRKTTHDCTSLVLYVCFVDRCLSFCTFSFGHCVVCSSIYGLWLPL